MASTSSHRGTSLCVLVGPAFAKSKKKGCGGWVCLSAHTFSQSLAGTKKCPKEYQRPAFSVTRVILRPLADSLVGMESPTTLSKESNQKPRKTHPPSPAIRCLRFPSNIPKSIGFQPSSVKSLFAHQSKLTLTPSFCSFPCYRSELR